MKKAISSTHALTLLTLLIFSVFPLCLCVSSEAGGENRPNAQRPTPNATAETYRIRIENAQFGRVEVSTDGGKRYHVIGRVTEPATQTVAVKGTNEKGTVWKVERDSITLLTSTGRGLYLKPQEAKRRGKKLPGLPAVAPNALRINLAAGTGIWGELAPTLGSPVHLLNSRSGKPETFSEQYKPHLDDILLIQVARADEKGNVQSGESLTETVEKLEADYNAGAIARAKGKGQRIVSGTLTLKAALPPHEPEPITFVTFLIDGDEVSTSNNAPFVFEWETRGVSNGEHVVEVKAYNKEYRLLTQTRLLLVVKNKDLSTD